MKYIIHGLFFLIAQMICGQTTLEGSVMDSELNEVVIGANIKMMQKDKLVKGVATDLDGRFLVSLEPGVYSLQVSYAGMYALVITDVLVKENLRNELDGQIWLESTNEMMGCEFTINYRNPLINKENNAGGQTLLAYQIHPLAEAGSSRSSSYSPRRKSKKPK